MLEYDRKTLGEYLRTAREKANLTQAEVSKRIGYSTPQFVSNIERGASVAPVPTLAKMAKLYKIAIGKLVDILLDGQRQILIKEFRQARKP